MRLFCILSTVVCLVQGCYSQRLAPPKNVAPTSMVLRVTGYCSCGTCCNWHRTWWGLGSPVVKKGPNAGKPKQIGQTASGVTAQRGTVAADTSVIPFGSILYIPGYGYGKVEDRGGAVVGRHIDLWFPTHEQAKAWGSKRLNVKVWKHE